MKRSRRLAALSVVVALAGAVLSVPMTAAQPSGLTVVAGSPAGLVLIDPATGTRTALSGSDAADRAPSVSPNGSHVAFERAGDLFVAGFPAGSGRTVLAAGPGLTRPVWTPDGSRILFACGGGLCAVPPTGGPVTAIGSTRPGDHDPAVAPAGDRVALTADDGIFVVPLAGPGGRSRVGGSAPGDAHPSLLTDGSVLVSSPDGIVRIGASGSRTLLAGSRPGDTRPSVAVGGDDVLVSSAADGLFVLALDGSPARQAVAGSLPGDGDGAWATRAPDTPLEDVGRASVTQLSGPVFALAGREATYSATLVNAGSATLPAAHVLLEAFVPAPLFLPDTDGDGWVDSAEVEAGTDPRRRDVSPEAATAEGTCGDGRDNDADGLLDAADDACSVHEELACLRPPGSSSLPAPAPSRSAPHRIVASGPRQANDHRLYIDQSDADVDFSALAERASSAGLTPEFATGVDEDDVTSHVAAAGRGDAYVYIGHSLDRNGDDRTDGLAPDGSHLAIEAFESARLADRPLVPRLVILIGCKTFDLAGVLRQGGVEIFIGVKETVQVGLVGRASEVLLRRLVAGATFTAAVGEATRQLQADHARDVRGKTLPSFAVSGLQSADAGSLTMQDLLGLPAVAPPRIVASDRSTGPALTNGGAASGAKPGPAWAIPASVPGLQRRSITARHDVRVVADFVVFDLAPGTVRHNATLLLESPSVRLTPVVVSAWSGDRRQPPTQTDRANAVTIAVLAPLPTTAAATLPGRQLYRAWLVGAVRVGRDVTQEQLAASLASR